MKKDSLMIVEKESIFSKLKRFFRNIFKKKEKVQIVNDVETKEVYRENISNSLQNLVQNEVTNELIGKMEVEKIEKLANQIGKNKEELRKLDIETLRKIDKYYDVGIKKLKSKLNVS